MRDDVENASLPEARYRQGEALARLANLSDYDARLRRAEHRRAVDRIFSEGFMIALSVLLIPILVVPFFFSVSPSIAAATEFLYYAILLFFILEYVLKLYYSDDRGRFVRSPIHLFDLFIIVASVVATVVGLFPEAGGLPILLRLLRLPVAVVLGGRSLSRGGLISREAVLPALPPPLTETTLDLSDPARGWERPEGVAGGGPREWRRFENVSDEHLASLGRRYGLSGLVLGGRIWDWAYPGAERTGDRTTIFLQVPVRERSPLYPASDLLRWVGLLLIDREEGIISLSRGAVPLLDTVPEAAAREGMALSTATVFFLVMSVSLGRTEDFIHGAEVELARLQATPMGRRPRAFLTVTYGVKKEIDHTVAWLVHSREVMKNLLDRSLTLQDWGEEDDVRIKALLERCNFLLETAEDLADGLADDIGFYLDTSSFQMNKVMKVIAVLTALTIVPTVVGGLLGMNVIGSPWEVSLAEVVAAVAVVMLFTAWIFNQMGWMKS